jgi:hypothetical protein
MSDALVLPKETVPILTGTKEKTSVDKVDVGKVDKVDVGKVDKVDVGKVDKADVGKVDKADVGKVDKVDVGKVDKVDVGTVDKNKNSYNDNYRDFLLAPLPGDETDPTFYVMTPELESVANLTKGYLNKWHKKDKNGESLHDFYSGKWVGSANLLQLSWAILAATSYLRIKHVEDSTQTPMLVRVLKSGVVQSARNVIKADNYLVRTFVRPYVVREEFDYRVNIGKTEYYTSLGDCNVWTLTKAFFAQITTLIDSLFPRKFKNTPLFGSSELSTDKTLQARDYLTMRIIEDATYHGKVDIGIIDTLYQLKDSYNNLLKNNPNFSGAFRVSSTLRRAKIEADKAKRREEFAKQRAERVNQNKDSNKGQSLNPKNDRKHPRYQKVLPNNPTQGGKGVAFREESKNEKKSVNNRFRGQSTNQQKPTKNQRRKEKFIPRIDEDGFRLVVRNNNGDFKPKLET